MFGNNNSTILKQKLTKTLIMAVSLTFVFVGLAVALNLANADGIWSNATGPGETPACLHYKNTAPTDDENQVAYGLPVATDGFCPNEADVNVQSGFGFDGQESLTFDPGQVFLLGEFTHYNHRLFATLQPFEEVDLTVGLVFSEPVLTTDLNFTVQLEETTNDPTGNCDYGDDDDTPCPDKVDFTDVIPDETFNIDGTLYTLQIVGFISGTLATGCNPDDSPPINQFITQEDATNHACLFGRIIVAAPAIAIDKSVDQNLVSSGATVNYSYEVTNIGQVPLEEIEVDDDKCSPVTPIIDANGFNVGDTDPQNNTLDLTEAWQFECAAVINVETTNTATATGTPAGGSPVVSEPDQETVEIVTAIDLASFTVEANDSRVVVLWETGTEIDNAGFNLYRTTSPDGPWVKINNALIAAEGDPVSGGSYTYVDTPGRGVFYYRLEDVDLSDLSTLHDPIMARLGPALRRPWFRPVMPGF